jgi:hypothetical protein
VRLHFPDHAEKQPRYDRHTTSCSSRVRRLEGGGNVMPCTRSPSSMPPHQSINRSRHIPSFPSPTPSSASIAFRVLSLKLLNPNCRKHLPTSHSAYRLPYPFRHHSLFPFGKSLILIRSSNSFVFLLPFDLIGFLSLLFTTLTIPTR